MNKEIFLRTELGSALKECITAWDKAIEERRKVTPGVSSQTETDKGMGYHYWDNICKHCQAQWEVYQIAIKQFYGVEYHFTRTDGCLGIVTEDGTDWLFRVERKTPSAKTKVVRVDGVTRRVPIDY